MTGHRAKRGAQNITGTPIPPKKRRRHSYIAIYNPPVSRLKRNYHEEFQKFLKSVQIVTDHMNFQKQNQILPLRKQLRGLRKRSAMIHLYLKTLSHWKRFYSEYIKRMNDVMDCFALTDLREVEVVVKEHKLPEELESFVTQQLMEWRELFADVPWMKEYRLLCEKIKNQEKQEKEEAERLELIQMISLEMELSRLDIQEFLPLSENPEKLTDTIIERIFEENKAKQTADQLKNMPVLSRRNNTKEWCRKHWESPICSGASSSASDDDSSFESSSSMSEGGGGSSLELSTSSEEEEENVDSFFSNRGL